MKNKDLNNSKEKISPVGYISLLDFLHQNKIDDKEIREVFDDTLNNHDDLVSQFLHNPNVIKSFNQETIKDDSNLEGFGYKNYQELATTIETYQINNPEADLKNPHTQRKLLEEYRMTHKGLDILANKQHAGDRITATISELIQNAIDATAQAYNETITPIGKFGMGAKTMFGSMVKDDYLLIQSQERILLIVQTGTDINSLIISQKPDFIAKQLEKRNKTIPEYQAGGGSIITLSYKSANLDSISSGVGKFRYNPNVEILENGRIINQFNPEELQTEGVVSLETYSDEDSLTITIKDQGKGFDPIKLFESSTKNSENRYSNDFNHDSHAHINTNETEDLILLIQDTVVTTEKIKDKERYIPQSLINGIVIENKNYLQTSESRSDWSCNDMTAKSLEFSLNNLINQQITVKNQTSLINTLYLWYKQLPSQKQLSLQNLKLLLLSKTKELKSTNSDLSYLPNLKEFQQFGNLDTIYLHPDLIGFYTPEKITNAKFIKSINGFALWSLPMEKIRKNNIKDLEFIAKGQSIESLNLSNVIKLEKSLPPQIWINNAILEQMESIENNTEVTQEQIEKYNQIVWLLNTELNEIDTGYKTVKPQFQYYQSYQDLQKCKKIEEVKAQTGSYKEVVKELNEAYNLQDTEYLRKVVSILERQKPKLSQMEIQVLKHSDEALDYVHREFVISIDETIFKIKIEGVTIKLIYTQERERGEEYPNQTQMTMNRSIARLIKEFEVENSFSKMVNKEKIKLLIESILKESDSMKTTHYNKRTEDIEALLRELFIEQEQEKEKHQEDLKQICKITCKNSENYKKLLIQYGDKLLEFKMKNEEVIATIDSTKSTAQSIALDIINTTDFETMLNDIKNGYLRIDHIVLNNFCESLYKFYNQGEPISAEIFSQLEKELTNHKNRMGKEYIEARSFAGSIEYKLEKSGYIHKLNIDHDFCWLQTKDKNGNLIIQSQIITDTDFAESDIKKIQERIDNLSSQKKYFKVSRNFINTTRVMLNEQDNTPVLNSMLSKLVLEVVSDKYSKPELTESEYIVNKSIGALIVLEGGQYTIELVSLGEDNMIDIVKIYDSKSMEEITRFGFEFLIDRNNLPDLEKIDFKNLTQQIDFLQATNDPIQIASFVNYLTNQLSEVKQHSEVTLVKQPITKAKLEEYAKLATEMEKILIYLNPLYQKNIMSSKLQGTQTETQLEEYKNTYKALIEFLSQDTKNILENILDVQLRLVQNNYKSFDLINNITYFPSILHKIQLLQQSAGLSILEKSLIIFAVLSWDSYKDGKEVEIIKIIKNLAKITTVLNESQKSVFDDLLTFLNSEMFTTENSSFLEQTVTITDNLTRIKEEKPAFFDYLIEKLVTVNNSGVPLLRKVCKGPQGIESKDQSLFRFLTIPNAVLLTINTIEPLEVKKDKTILLQNTTIGELAIASRSLMTPKDLKEEPFALVKENPNASKKAKESDIEYNRLATSQVVEKIETVIRELIQNSKDAGNKLAKIKEKEYLKDHNNQAKSEEEQTRELAELQKFTISLNQDIYQPELNSDPVFESDTRYLRTVFCDDATGIPNFLFNYFNPMKSTKDVADAISAGAFGCGAITINSIADSYEITTKNIHEEDGFLIRVKVSKSKDRTQVVATEVVEVSRVKDLKNGTEIRIYTKEQDGSTIFEVQGLQTQSAYLSNSELESFNNPNLVLKSQKETLLKPDFYQEYNSDKVQFVKGPRIGYWVKNLFISDFNHEQNQFTKPLPKLISQMLKDNPIAINFHEKLELVRTRNGFTQEGEEKATNILVAEYLTYIANQIFNGSNINIPELDTNLSYSYKNYISMYITEIKEKLFNTQVSLSELSELTNRELIGVMLQMPINNKEGLETNLAEMFEVNEQIAESIKKNTFDLRNHQTVEKEKNKLLDKMPEAQREIYRMLERSSMTNTYKATGLHPRVNLDLTSNQMKEKILKLEDLDQETLEKTAKLRKIFNQTFETLTRGLPISRNYSSTKHEYDFVTRTAGNDHLGKKDGDRFYWKFNIDNILSLINTSNLSPREYEELLTVIVHEVAHHLENLGVRGNGGHDTIFQEFMRLNYSKLLQELTLTKQI